MSTTPEVSILQSPSEDEDQYEPPIEIIDLARCVVMGIIGVVCIVGNILVMRTLICFKYPKIAMYVAIGGMALADILRALFEVPVNIMNWTYKTDIATSAWCNANNYLRTSGMYIAALHLVALSAIRGILLNDRGHSRSYVPHTVIGSLIIWVVTMLTNIPSVMSQTMDEELKWCVEVDSALHESDEKQMWLRISFSFIGPIVVIMTVYFITYCFSKRYFQDSYSRSERRLARMVTILIATWAVCKLPFEILNIVVFYRSRVINKMLLEEPMDEGNEKEFSNFLFLEKVEKNLECLSLIDLAMRPIIYAKFSSYFSTSFDEVINCTTCRESRKPHRGLRGSKSKIRHARMSERISESETHAQTPLTEMTMEVTENTQYAEVMIHATELQQTSKQAGTKCSLK